jgi:TRAP-type uncharacterized transport system fused permease subunit
MVGALVVALVAALGTFFFASKNKNEQVRSNGLAMFFAVVAAIWLLIAFPNLLSVGGKMSVIALGLVGAIGVIIMLLAKKFPTAPMLIIGAALIAWAFFHWLPTGPSAFQFLGEHVTTAGNSMFDGVKGFFKILFQSKPLQDANKK